MLSDAGYKIKVLNTINFKKSIRIVDFNKLPVLSFLGNAVSEQCEAVLFDIGREMRKIYKKRNHAAA